MAKKSKKTQETAKPKDAEPATPKDLKKAKSASSGFDAVRFLKETREELSKVVWPSRQQLISESLAVILMVALVATVVYFFDNFFIWLASRIFG